jgi:hypothetical protein
VTLIFSLERYAEVIDAYLAGLEQAKAAGHDLSGIHSVASFFVSRVDTEVDKRLSAFESEDAEALKSRRAWRTRVWPTSCSSSSSRPRALRSSSPPARTCSVRCGPRPA